MPSKKTFTIIILCFAIVVSVWILFRTPVKKTAITRNNNTSLESLIKLPEDTSDNWKKILTQIDSKNEKVVDLTKNNEEVFEETTLTAQMARDFMSQYLLLKGSNESLSGVEVDNIALSVLSTKEYLQTGGAVYILSNLNMADNSNLSVLNNYKNSMTVIIRNLLGKIKVEPHLIVAKAVSENNEVILTALDPMIKAARVAIEELLIVQVPIKGSKTHLELVNSLSKVLSDVEAMRVLFVDPVRSFAAINQYPTDADEFINSLNAMSSYLASI